MELIESLNKPLNGYKKDANEMTHSLYHIADKEELDNKKFQQILSVIKKLDEAI